MSSRVGRWMLNARVLVRMLVNDAGATAEDFVALGG
jgi:hypothetical protein